MAIDDGRRDDPIIGERTTDDAALAMMQRPHRVEQVRDRTHARVDRIADLRVGSHRMPGRNGDAVGHEFTDHGKRTRKLRGQRDTPDTVLP